MTIQKALASFDLEPFDFRGFPAREENGKIIVGEGSYEVTWNGGATHFDCASFLSSARIHRQFKDKAAVLADNDSQESECCDTEDETFFSGDIPKCPTDLHWRGVRTEQNPVDNSHGSASEE
jgi:hypothetical protein